MCGCVVYVVSYGFVVLLGGVRDGDQDEQQEREQPQQTDDLTLSFLALTQGNVLDACFGAGGHGREETPASLGVREAKAILGDCESVGPEGFRRVAVDAYRGAFELVLVHREQLDALDFCSRCFRSMVMRETATKDLHENFIGLARAIAEIRGDDGRRMEHVA